MYKYITERNITFDTKCCKDGFFVQESCDCKSSFTGILNNINNTK